MNLKFWDRKPQPKLLPSGSGIVLQTAEERLGVFCAQDADGHPIFTDSFLHDPSKRRDAVRTERTVAVHAWRPDINSILEYVSEFSLLSLAIPKDPEDFDLQQERVRLGNEYHQMWQIATRNWAFPRDDMQFGRTSIIWADAGRMIPENNYTRTASAYGIIPEWNQTASLINSALLGRKIDFLNSYAPGSQLSKTMVGNIKWGSNNGRPHNDTYSIGSRSWGIWAVRVKPDQLYRLMRRPFDVLAYAMKESKGSETPEKVRSGETNDFFISLFVRVEEDLHLVTKGEKTTEISSLKSIDSELRTIAEESIRLSGQNLVDIFQAMVPGSPPPKGSFGIMQSLTDTEWRPYLNEMVRHNNVAHAITATTNIPSKKRSVFLGKAALVKEQEDGTIDLADPNGPSVFLDTADFTSLGMIDVSGEGKTTYELFLFLQRFGPFAVILNLAPGVNEAGDFLVRNFDTPENGDRHVKVLSFDEQKHSEADAQNDGVKYANHILREMKFTGTFVASPLYITTSNRSPLAHTWMEYFIKTFRQGWRELSQVGDDIANTKPGIFAGQTLGLMIDNVSSARTHGGLLLELEDLANNGKNQNIQSDHLSHTEEGLPRSYVDSLAYKIRVWRIDNHFIYRVFKKDGKPLTPYINGTLPEYMANWFVRRDDVNVRKSRK